jgi:hypothetical protein
MGELAGGSMGRQHKIITPQKGFPVKRTITRLGIVWVKGDEMRLCYVQRPAKFESTKDSGALFWTLNCNAK